MNNYSSHPSRKAHFAVGDSNLIGMIRARKLAIKIKKRAQFLVADKRRRDNTGRAILVHRDFPERIIQQRRLFYDSNEFSEYRDDRADRMIASSSGETLQRSAQDYQTKPDGIFPARSVEEHISRLLQVRLSGIRYNPERCKELSKSLAEEIKQDVKAHHKLMRYKLICVVNIGETGHQSTACFGSRCLWNAKFDNFASSFYRNAQIFAVATIYGVYFE